MGLYHTLDDVDTRGKRVLLRVDLNVPIQEGKVTDTSRIDRIVPTLNELRYNGARVIMLSHFDRPKGKRVPEMSLEQVVPALEQALGCKVGFVDECIGKAVEDAVAQMRAGDVLLLENTRFHKGEEDNDIVFAGGVARLGDVFVLDAFSIAHRAHATTEAITHLIPAAAGRAMEAELDALAKVLLMPTRPVVAIVGGAKVSTKLELLGNLVGRVDRLVIGGGMANTFLAAKGVAIGKSLCERDLLETAREILKKAQGARCEIVLPRDAVVAREFKANAASQTVSVNEVPADGMILDVGSETLSDIATALSDAKTVVWNGPLGAFELTPFDTGTVTAARQVAMLTRMGKLISVAGGGDTLAALNIAGVTDDFTYVSTAGGAFLEWLEGKELPGVKALEKR
ncbi:MAG: phosphoglycerate kinase [Alphaproteobacteria bacterium]|nr:phosphoglycerate kinase [Alphaproteobacteria bacterium]